MTDETLKFLKRTFIQVNGDEALVDLGISQPRFVLKSNYIEYVSWDGVRHFFSKKFISESVKGFFSNELKKGVSQND